MTADVKTAGALGCYAATCITALTVQSTRGVFAVQPVAPRLVSDTLKVLSEDLAIAGVRVGMLGSGEVAKAVAGFLEDRGLPNVVLDPVIRSSSGAPLIDAAGLEVIRRRLLPLSTIATPNVEEAAWLTDCPAIPPGASWEERSADLLHLADKLHLLGAPALVLTGGHLQPPNDLLSYSEDGLRQEQVLRGSRVESRATHGTGCAFATAIACELGLRRALPEAVRAAKAFVRQAIEAAYPVGGGVGPVNHLFRL